MADETVLAQPPVIEDFLPPPPPPPSDKKKWLWLLLLIPVCCICLVAVGVIGYFVFTPDGAGFSLPFLGTPKPDVVRVGCFNMDAAGCSTGVTSAISSLGYEVVNLSSLSATDLAGIQVLTVFNPSNDAYSETYLMNTVAIDAAVKNGVVLLVHDRLVSQVSTSASYILPGGAEILFTRSVDNPVDISNFDNGLISGPGGTLTDISLDNGNSSRHGYADINSLPAGTTVILNAGDASQAAVFSYKYGTGYVIYSSIPLDFYLDSGDSSEFSYLYAPNVFQYAIDLFTGN